MSEEQIISEFNEAKFQIYRLHNLWLKAEQQRSSGKLVDCRWTLDSVEVELHTDIKRLDKEKEDNKYGEKLAKLEKDIEESKEKKEVDKFYVALKKKEMLLREIQDHSGKGGRYKNLDDDYQI